MLAAALDFQRSVPSGKGLVYPSFARAGSWIALPHTLDVARQADGIPDFHLELVRLRRSAGELTGYGTLDVRVTPVLDLAVVKVSKGAALDTLRERVVADGVLFAGDDVTDETAFARLRPGDVGVKVGDGETAAAFRVAGPADVAVLLERLLALRT